MNTAFRGSDCFRGVSVALASLLFVAGSFRLLAGPYNPLVFEDVEPGEATRGATVDVVLSGYNLESPQELVSDRGGIRFFSVEALTEEGADFDGKKLKHMKAKLEIAPNCPLGRHLLTLRTNRFLSFPVLFHVGALPIVKELEKNNGDNNTPEKAETIAFNTTVHGQIQGGKRIDRDFYAFEVKKGQRISLELEAARLGLQSDCFIRLTGPEGKVLAASDDTPLAIQDPLISVQAPVAGKYTVEVSQPPGTGGGAYFLHVGSFPRPTTAYPLGGKPGEKLSLIWLGDGLGLKNAIVQLPTSPERPGPLSVFEYVPEENGQFAPSPLFLRVTSHPNVMEVEPNDTLEKAQSFAIPSALNGIIQKPGDVDLWKFHAEKGQSLDIRVFAAMLGTPLDAKVWIRPARPPAEDERPLVEVDDSNEASRGYFDNTTGAGSRQMKGLADPALTFTPKETGDYILGIEDTRGMGGLDFVYRIEVEPHVNTVGISPAVQYLKEGPRYEAIQIPQGNRWTLTLRHHNGLGSNLQGDFTVEATGLPPGVTLISPRVPPNPHEFPVQFVAGPDAKPGISNIQLFLRSVDNKQAVETLCQKRTNHGFCSVFAEKFPLAVVGSAPFHLEMEQPPSGLCRSGEVTLKAKVVREGGWNGPVAVKFDWAPPGVEFPIEVDVPPGQTEVKLLLRAKADAPLGAWKVSAIARTEGHQVSGLGSRLVASPFVDLVVTEPFVTVNFQRASVEKGGKGQLIADLKHSKPFSGKARATLNRLPNGVKLIEPIPEISAGDKQCIFHIEATADALTGQYKEIQAEIAVNEAGQTIRQQSGSGILRVDPTRGK